MVSAAVPKDGVELRTIHVFAQMINFHNSGKK